MKGSKTPFCADYRVRAVGELWSHRVDRCSANAGVRRMTCAEQFRVMAFAQLTWRESLRDIEVTLGANANKL